jgi:hypothetical protein
MKNLLFMCLVFAAFGMVSMSSDQPITFVDGEPSEYIYIKLKNECNHAVKYEYRYSSGATSAARSSKTSGVLSANFQRQITLRVGAELYVAGEFIQVITKEDDKQVIMACQ